jgi:hypothetical protein
MNGDHFELLILLTLGYLFPNYFEIVSKKLVNFFLLIPELDIFRSYPY